MFVIPYSMGPIGSPIAKIGVEITDSPYVVAQHARHGAGREPRTEALGQRRRVRARAPLGGAPLADGASRLAVAVQRRDPVTSATFPRRARSGRCGPATAATHCSARSVTRCDIASGAGARRGLAGRAHADPRHHQSRRAKIFVAAAFPIGMRQDQPGDDGPHAAGMGGSRPSATTSAWMKFGADGRLHAINPEARLLRRGAGTSARRNQVATRHTRRPARSSLTARLTPPEGVHGGRQLSDHPPAETVGLAEAPLIHSQSGRRAAHA